MCPADPASGASPRRRLAPAPRWPRPASLTEPRARGQCGESPDGLGGCRWSLRSREARDRGENIATAGLMGGRNHEPVGPRRSPHRAAAGRRPETGLLREGARTGPSCGTRFSSTEGRRGWGTRVTARRQQGPPRGALRSGRGSPRVPVTVRYVRKRLPVLVGRSSGGLENSPGLRATRSECHLA